MRRPSSVYTTRLKFRFAQLVINAIALFAIGAGMAAYFKGKSFLLSILILFQIVIFVKLYNSSKSVIKILKYFQIFRP